MAMLNITKIFDTTDAPSANQGTLVHDQYNQQVDLSATSDPTATGMMVDDGPLVAGARTIDLTACDGGNQNTVDLTGKKMLALLFVNPAGNAAMTISPGGVSNPYEPFGASNDVVVPAGGFLLAHFDDELAAVGSGAKNLSISGTGTQSYKLIALFGDT